MDKILLLGDPRLRVVCETVTDFGAPGYGDEVRRLKGALERFRAEHGFGRAISAPQIGIPRRMVAMNLGEGPFVIANPVLTTLSEESFTLWDDCMSLPWLMVRLQRHLRVKLDFCDEEGRPQEWDSVDQALSELLQHEVDHLNAILAVDRALDRRSIIAREVYLERRRFFDSQVDYAIQPTIRA